ncbi:hypothetical protein J7E25_00895 [Agromyces sp. ISL-38]|uniref:hypothetical protein n=1 Tax=Agromyces sp. ISL-38 TaxID=2819107 RepID=UPI001BE6AAFE|nr:hypothetical protein [Agromyces sp. ISL-38]MBT2497647.1 hypothetical protein [Agromyces sp. ISL-38]
MADELSGIIVALPHGRALSMAELMSGWRQHVHRLALEASRPRTDTDWGGHDLVAALTLRDFIAGGMTSLTDSQLSLVAEQLAAIDDEYRGFTEPDLTGALRTFAERPLADRLWWWDRLPVSGLAREELLR